MTAANGIAFDIEADDLYDSVTKIHVVCWRSLENPDEDFGYFREPAECKRWLWETKPKVVVAHNGIGYDLPTLRLLWGIPYTVGKRDSWGGFDTSIVDTFQLSSFLWPDRPGGHSLDNLSRLAGGSVKQDYKGGFAEFTPEMLDYCHGDTLATVSVYRYLLKEAKEKYE